VPIARVRSLYLVIAISRAARQLGIDSAYLLVAFPVGVVGFVVVFTLFCAGLGMLITVVGVPVLVASFYAAQGLATVERLRLPAVLNRSIPHPRYRQAAPGSGIWRRLVTPLGDGQRWFDLLHAISYWILATVGFSFLVTWWAGVLGGLTYGLWGRFLPRDPNSTDLNVMLGLHDTYAARVELNLVLGLIFLLTLVPVTRLFALAQAQFSRVLLSGLAEVRERISDLSSQRDSAVSAEAIALRRLERDIHDGPQQRLVRLAMDLGRARQQVDTNPAAVARTLEEALSQARETLEELRALSRGIAPPILTDRGLAAALHALAARGLIPVSVTVDPEVGRPAVAIESTAYFVVAEALANVAKHSRATVCGVEVRRSVDHLIVVVVDDGAGGAHLAKGHGLAGLTDRVHAVGGTLSVTSPNGGPTEIRAELPCA
jgi:signal transduction histidine kinase